MLSPLMHHSAKPPTVYDRIERLMEGDDYLTHDRKLVYLELFARNLHPGWLSMGLDLPKPGEGKDIRQVLARPEQLALPG